MLNHNELMRTNEQRITLRITCPRQLRDREAKRARAIRRPAYHHCALQRLAIVQNAGPFRRKKARRPFGSYFLAANRGKKAYFRSSGEPVFGLLDYENDSGKTLPEKSFSTKLTSRQERGHGGTTCAKGRVSVSPIRLAND
jgi:hypothetical protein